MFAGTSERASGRAGERASGRAGRQAGGRAGTDAGGAMLLTEGFLGWLSRFKLIRLRRISLATLRRDGWRDRYLYIIDCLRQVVAFAPKVIKCATYGVAQGRGAGLALL